jgi:hypothetical protein
VLTSSNLTLSSSTSGQVTAPRRRSSRPKIDDIGINLYTNAQADPHGFLYPNQNEELSMKYSTATRTRKRTSSSDGAKRHGNRLATLVHNRIVDLMFPSSALSDEDIESKKAEAIQKRKAASQKVKNWRANGRPCLRQTFRLGNPAAVTDRSLRPGVSQTGLAPPKLQEVVLACA